MTPPPKILFETMGSDMPQSFNASETPDERVFASRDYVHRFVANAGGEPLIAEGWLRRRIGPRPPVDRSLHRAVTRGLPRLHAAHLIADVFGGPDVYGNLVPYPATVNLGHWKQLENAIGGKLDAGPVYLKVFVARVGREFIPDHLLFHCYAPGPRGALLVHRDTLNFEGFGH